MFFMDIKMDKKMDELTKYEQEIIDYIIDNMDGLAGTKLSDDKIRIARILLDDFGDSLSIDNDGWIYYDDKLIYQLFDECL